MLSIVLLWWIGLQLNAPVWYWLILVAKFSIEIIRATVQALKKS